MHGNMQIEFHFKNKNSEKNQGYPNPILGYPENIFCSSWRRNLRVIGSKYQNDE